MTFSFGKNWKKYIKYAYNKEKLSQAENSIKGFIGLDNFNGLTFLDIGCGSGIFSLVAYRMGASKVVSIDLDKHSVECTEMIRGSNRSRWEVYQADILKDQLPKSDIVYSWGVLHHTGKMYESIRKTANLVNEDGLLYITIYNKLETRFGSYFYLKLKKLYNRSPGIIRWLMIHSKIALFFVYNIATLQNPFKKIYKNKDRGMSWYYDIIDGLGGYPYEFAKPEEIIFFVEKLGFKLINLKTTNGISNNEYLFRRMWL